MDIFLGAEIEGSATSKWFELQKEFSELLLELKNKNYGLELKYIGIISIIMRTNYYEEGGYKERSYYSKKRKEADIRLRLDYVDFVKASKEERKQIYIEHILEAIRIAGEKAGKMFETDRLLNDVENLLK